MIGSEPQVGAEVRLVTLVASVALALLAVLATAVRGVGALDADRAVLRSFSAAPSSLADLSLQLVPLALPAVAAASVAAAIAGVLVPRARRVALFVLLTVPVVIVLKWVLKLHDTRPGPFPGGGLDEFPSGHAAGTLALALVIVLLVPSRWRASAGVVLIGLAFAVGFGLVLGRVHYATDVLGGWLLSLAWVPLVWLGLIRDRTRGGLTASCRSVLGAVVANVPRSRERRRR